MYYISKYIEIKEGCIYKNGELEMQSSTSDFSDMMKEWYKSLHLSYPKFYKMDDLCKMAFIASERLLEGETSKEIALLFSNSEASLDTDIKHQQSIQTTDAYFPSPAIFVYTLPNIAIGEVSIRHQLKTESAFLVSDEYPIEEMHTYTEYLLQHKKAEKVLCAWIHKLENSYHAFFYLVENQGDLPHTKQIINKIFI